MISLCLPFCCCFPNNRHIHHRHRPRRPYRRHRGSLYDVPLIVPPPLPNPIFIPPSPPPPELDPLALVPLPRPETPLERLPIALYRPRSPPLLPIQPRVVPVPIPYPERVPYLERIPYLERVPVLDRIPYPDPIPYLEPVPYPQPVLYPQPICYPQPIPVPIFYPQPVPSPEQNIQPEIIICPVFIPYPIPIPDHDDSPNDIPESPNHNLASMVGSYGSYLRPDDLRAAVEIALDMVLRELREPDYYRDRGVRFGRGGLGLGSDSSRLSDLELEEYIRRMNLVVQIANNSVNPRLMHAEVHPKISEIGSDAGRYPRDFERPRRLEDFFVMDSSTLDRILLAYGLPRDGLGLGFGLRSSLSGLDLRRGGLGLSDNDRNREQKLRNLFEFLGVDVRDGLRFDDRLSDGLGRLGGLGRLSGGRMGLGSLLDRTGSLDERFGRRLRD